jgi:hypothetical protein
LHALKALNPFIYTLFTKELQRTFLNSHVSGEELDLPSDTLSTEMPKESPPDNSESKEQENKEEEESDESDEEIQNSESLRANL